MRLGDLELRPWEPQGWRLEARGGSWACFQADGIPLCLEAFGPRILRLRLGEERPDYGLLQANPWGELRLAWGTDWLEAHSGDAGLALALNPLRLTFSLRGRPILTSATDGHIRGGPRLPSLAQGPG
ncbi:hypothetical protein, partial [Thermus sp.]|uniref:hypothetical protein n=1 Tax=Thermus sp. TaxID=275 RepID=UPI00298F2CF4